MHKSGDLDERYDEMDDLVSARNNPSTQLVGTPERITLDLNALTDKGIRLRGKLADDDVPNRPIPPRPGTRLHGRFDPPPSPDRTPSGRRLSVCIVGVFGVVVAGVEDLPGRPSNRTQGGLKYWFKTSYATTHHPIDLSRRNG